MWKNRYDGNIGDLYQMKKGIAAILYHCSEYLVQFGADKEKNVPYNDARHKYCPRGKDSWCKYQREQATGESTYKTKINIPEAVRELIIPIFSHEDLGSDDLLKKCLHGQAQNPNESFNNCVWRKAPKETLEVAVASVVIHLNDGGKGRKGDIMEKCGFFTWPLYSFRVCPK